MQETDFPRNIFEDTVARVEKNYFDIFKKLIEETRAENTNPNQRFIEKACEIIDIIIEHF